MLALGVLTLIHVARADNECMSSMEKEAYDDDLTQLRNIALSLAGHIQPGQGFCNNDCCIPVHLHLLMDLFHDARRLQNSIRGTEDDCTAVISGFGLCTSRNAYIIGFAHDKHVGLIDFITNFVGIPDDMVVYEVWGVFSHHIAIEEDF